MELAVDDAKDRLPDLVRRAEAGENVVLTRHGHAVAQLVSVALCPNAKKRSEIDVNKRRAIIEERSARTPPLKRKRVPMRREAKISSMTQGLPG